MSLTQLAVVLGLVCIILAFATSASATVIWVIAAIGIACVLFDSEFVRARREA